MARLIDPKTGTAVHVDGSLERRYRAQGWSEVAASVQDEEVSEPDLDLPEPEAEEAEEKPEEEGDKAATRRNTRRAK